MNEDSARVRLDRWLWAARFFKTRSEATTAVSGGRVHVNGARSKPAKILALGDELRIRKGPVEFQVVVRGLTDRRGPAAVARTLYEESEVSRAARALVSLRQRARPNPVYDGKGRPTKRDRRALERWHDETLP